jgi:predicted transposase/invertase (TIGR01784 family)
MRHRIDPKIDCVFKALLGSEDNRVLLIHFLNALLGRELPAPVTAVEILNPYNEREFLDDKLSIVDVKARDALGRLYQVEIQIEPHPDLPARLVYTWADLYSQQLQSGQDYGALRPTYAIWLLSKDLLKKNPAYAHRYRLRDDGGELLLEHGGIALFELSKFAATAVETEEQRWLKFFKEGERLDADHLPDWMQTHEMRQAMSTLKRFSDKERAYDAYQARQNYLRVQGSIARRQRELEEALAQERAAREAVLQEIEAERQAKEAERQAKEAERQAKEAALRDKDAERQAKEAALAELARLQALLRARRPPDEV